MRRLFLLICACTILVGAAVSAQAYSVGYDFNTAWTGDYAQGWENSAYRHGVAPVGKMMEYTSGYNGTGGMKLTAAAAANSQWWAIVNVQDSQVNAAAMKKQYNPWISVRYYDPGLAAGTLQATGQLYSVPSWVNGYTGANKDEDWTDVQFGARFNQASPNDDYYYVAAGQGSPGWVNTGVDRADDGWVQLKMQLLNSDGKIHFFINGIDKGESYRADYADLLTPSLATMFTAPLSGWGDNKPFTVWDDFAFGSDAPAVPEPMSIMLGIMGLGSIAGFRKFRK